MPRRFSRSGVGWGNPTVPSPTTLTGGATDTKGSWTEIMAAASVLRDCYGFYYVTHTNIGSNGADTSALIDFGVGGSGSSVDRSLIENIPIGAWMFPSSLFIPVHVPAGTRLCARIQGVVASETVTGHVIMLYGTNPPYFGGFYAGDSLGITLADSGPTLGDLTDSAWEQVVASTSREYLATSGVVCCVPADTSASASTHTVDWGIGAGGAEEVLGTCSVQTTANENIYTNGMYVSNRVIPAGSRLAMRKNSTNDTSGTILGWY